MMFVTLTDGVAAYKTTYLASRNYAPRTRREYLTDLRQLVAYLASISVTTVDEVQRRHLEGFLAQLDHQGRSDTIRRRKLAAIRSFFLFLEGLGSRTGNPAADVIPPALARSTPRYLTQREYERLRYAVRAKPRDAALIELLLQTGLRLSEISHLRLTDIELPDRKDGLASTGSARIWRGRRYRMVTLNSKVCEALRGYLAIRPRDAADNLVFQSKLRRGMGPRSIEKAVSKYLTEAGIRDASVRTLRHTFAVHHLKQGTRLGVLQQALGHADRKTTAVYQDLARVEMDRQLQEHAL